MTTARRSAAASRREKSVRDGRRDRQQKHLAQRVGDLASHPRVLQILEMLEEICGHAACGGFRDNSNVFHCCPPPGGL